MRIKFNEVTGKEFHFNFGSSIYLRDMKEARQELVQR
jgi:hypothetical protein